MKRSVVASIQVVNKNYIMIALLLICIILPSIAAESNAILFEMQVNRFSESLVGHQRHTMISNFSAPFTASSLSIGTFVEMELRRTATIFPASRLQNSNSAEDLRSLRVIPRTSLVNDEQQQEETHHGSVDLPISNLNALTIDELIEGDQNIRALAPSNRPIRHARPPLPPSRLRRSSSSTSSFNSQDSETTPSRFSIAPDLDLLFGHSANVILVPPQLHNRVVRDIRNGGIHANWNRRIVQLFCRDENDKILLKEKSNNLNANDDGNQRIILDMCPVSGTKDNNFYS